MQETRQMIDKAMEFTHDALSRFLRNQFSLDEDKVVLNNLIDSNGSIPLQNQNKVIISLINIEKETTRPFYNRNQKLSGGTFSEINPSERYNLYILVTSSFDDYSETLKFLSASITFFQANVMMDSTTFPNMPGGLDRLEFDIEKITYHQMQGLWTSMGAKYQPSVVYKMRLLTFQANESKAFTSPVLQPNVNL